MSVYRVVYYSTTKLHLQPAILSIYHSINTNYKHRIPSTDNKKNNIQVAC